MKIALALALVAVVNGNGYYHYGAPHYYKPRPLVLHKGGAVAPLETMSVRAAQHYHANEWNNAALRATAIKPYSEEEKEDEKKTEETEEEKQIYGAKGFGLRTAGLYGAGLGHHYGAGLGHRWGGLSHWGNRWGGLGHYGNRWGGLGHYGNRWGGLSHYGNRWGSLAHHGGRFAGLPVTRYSEEKEEETATEEDADEKQIGYGDLRPWSGSYGFFGGLRPGYHYGGHHQFGGFPAGKLWGSRFPAVTRYSENEEEDQEDSEDEDEEKQILFGRQIYGRWWPGHLSGQYWGGRWGAGHWAGRPWW